MVLLYMSVFNLLSDWTCYSVAPIAILTQKAFGDIDHECLVVVFLGANGLVKPLNTMERVDIPSPVTPDPPKFQVT